MSTFDLDAWVHAEPDPVHRRLLLDARAADEVPPGAHTPLRFGTAGLRGRMGPGPGQMNRVVVRVAARALGRELVASRLADRGVIVGHDARPHSDEYALDSARVLRALGIPCALIDGPVPTPVLAREALARGVGAAVMATASHNPRGDNGYKVYWSDGAQIRSPIDARIEARMDFTELPSDDDLVPAGDVEMVPPAQAIADYVDSVITSRADAGPSPRVVYTPLCGVGADSIDLAFAAAGLEAVVHVPAEREPDGQFPGLPFPNPEEPGTLDRSIEMAEHEGLDVVLANDPDADRLGVAIREGDTWWTLTGDEIGTLLCDHRIRTTDGGDRVVASSIVSGGMVPALCEARGVRHVTTLTGFKWIMRPAIDEPDATWIFGYEEALGFSVSDRVRDKDGISAAVDFALLLADLDLLGSGPRERLEQLSQEIGTFTNDQVSIRGNGAQLDEGLEQFRLTPPETVGGHAVVSVDDWLSKPDPHQTNLLILGLAGGGRVAIRPSGTEAKIKMYLEWRSEPGGSPTADATANADRLREVAADVARWFD
ncbi:MAG: phospho-sugar mutase [Actinomycetota bacterium]|nr:phospho-sugar mutase [Actinomycetota bacterium]